MKAPTMTKRRTTTAAASDSDTAGGGRTWTLVLAAALVVTVVIGGVVALIISRSSDRGADSQAAVPVTPQLDRSDWGTPFLDGLGRRVEVPPNANGVALPQDSSLRADPDAPDYVRVAPAGVMWQQVDGVPIPFSTSDGPARIDGEIPAGFARTPQGAALATLQLSARLFASKQGALAIAATRLVFADDAGRQQTLDRFNSLGDNWPTMGSDRIEAYKVTYWSSDYAVVELAKAAAPGTVAQWETGRFELLWRDGDWQLKAGPVSGSTPATGQTASLAGWTPWPGK